MRFIGPGTIFFPIYIVSAIVISLIWLRKYSTSDSTWTSCMIAFFRRDVWLSRSCLVDFEFCFVMIFGLKFILGPFEDWIFHTHLNLMSGWLNVKTGIVWNFHAGIVTEGIIATAVTMISIDFASYCIHRFMHSNRILRKIHSVHHSASQLTFLTTHRQHPFEPLILNGSRSLAAAISLSVFHWFFPSQTPVILLFGLGAGFFIYMFTVNLHHSHVPVRYPAFLRKILISPHIHHIHHSRNPAHFGKNYGVVFSVWDRAFGTYFEADFEMGELCFGMDECEEVVSYWHSFIIKPIVSTLKCVKKLPAAATARALWCWSLFG